MLTGLFTAIITPFNDDQSIDESTLRNIVDRQITAGVDGLVPMGTTGESPTVTHRENLEVIRIVIEQAQGRVPIIAGTGSNSTSEAIDMTIKARELGASVSLQVAPYYNKPNQEGFFRHFTSIADETAMPLLIYNIPGRSAKNIEAETILQAAKHEGIVGVKEASGNINQVMDILARRPAGFTVLSGVDEITFSLMGLGADGGISVASNIIPDVMGRMIRACAQGNYVAAREQHYQMLPLLKGLFLDTNPIPVKYAMSLMGLCRDVYRLPLCEPSAAVKAEIQSILNTMALT